jgi:hypothetical protein
MNDSAGPGPGNGSGTGSGGSARAASGRALRAADAAADACGDTAGRQRLHRVVTPRTGMCPGCTAARLGPDAALKPPHAFTAAASPGAAACSSLNSLQ